MEPKPDGSARSKRDECPYCVFLIGAHNKAPAGRPPVLQRDSDSVYAVGPAAEAKKEPAEDEDECCICLEPLWSADGQGTKPGGLAELGCRHLMHSACLGQHTRREVEAAKASGVAANGHGPFGPRGQPLSQHALRPEGKICRALC